MSRWCGWWNYWKWAIRDELTGRYPDKLEMKETPPCSIDQSFSILCSNLFRFHSRTARLQLAKLYTWHAFEADVLLAGFHDDPVRSASSHASRHLHSLNSHDKNQSQPSQNFSAFSVVSNRNKNLFLSSIPPTHLSLDPLSKQNVMTTASPCLGGSYRITGRCGLLGYIYRYVATGRKNGMM